MKEAMFGAGCFWGVEYNFRLLKGVIDVKVGYSGGKTKNPTYKDVCTGRTGHAEVVHISYDPKKISYLQLLDHFWKIHDPTTPNRQGPDIGTQYRSSIFYYDEEQMEQAMESMMRQASRMNMTIVTEICHAGTFWPAEEYHQQYFKKNPKRRCHI